jgi:hypothetical protein
MVSTPARDPAKSSTDPVSANKECPKSCSRLHSAFPSGGSSVSSRCGHEGQHRGQTVARFFARSCSPKGAGQRQREKTREQISPEQIQWDAGKGDAAGCDCGFLLRTAAEISVMTSPIGKGSMNVIAALRSGLSYISLYFLIC